MPQPTYENIAPLIADLQVSGRSVRVTFRDPVSGETVQSNHSMPGTAGTSSQIANTAKRSLMYGLQSAVSGAIRDVFGYNLVGRVAGDVARQAMYSATSTTTSNSLSEKEKRQAVVEAFSRVSSRFVWDTGRNHWISAKAAKDLLSPFEQALAEKPVSTSYDRQILARMLVEVARADSRLSNEESAWMTEMISPDLGSVQDLAQRPPLTAPELNETTAAVRQNLLMIAWTLALADESFAAPEQQTLQRFAQGLRLGSAQIQAARQAAQGYVLDQALERMFTWGGHDAHARGELLALAQRLGMTEEEAHTAEARYQRRKGAF